MEKLIFDSWDMFAIDLNNIRVKLELPVADPREWAPETRTPPPPPRPIFFCFHAVFKENCLQY